MIAFSDPNLVENVTRVVGIGTLTFIIAFLLTPGLTRILYIYKFGKNIRNSGNTPLYSKLHAKKAGTPVGGGIIIWGTVAILAIFFWILSELFPSHLTFALNFLSSRINI